jgi:hypothetical protein
MESRTFILRNMKKAQMEAGLKAANFILQRGKNLIKD